jgi:hypothetical protein
MSISPTSAPAPNPRQIFIVADQFYRIISMVLREIMPDDASEIRMEGDIPYKIAPIIAMCAFSFELHLKCLLVIDGIPPPKSHDLEKVFAQLSPERKREIERRYNDVRRKSPTPSGEEHSMNRVLQRSRDAFNSHRYIYARPDPHLADSWLCSKLCNVVRDLIMELHPEWCPPPFTHSAPG